MISFLKTQYRLGKITEEQLNELLRKGKINESDIAIIKE